MAFAVIVFRWWSQVDPAASSTAGLAYFFAPIWAAVAALPFALLGFLIGAFWRAYRTRALLDVSYAAFASVVFIPYLQYTANEVHEEARLSAKVSYIASLDENGLAAFVKSDEYSRNRYALAAVAANPAANDVTLAEIAGIDDATIHESFTVDSYGQFLPYLLLNGWRSDWGELDSVYKLLPRIGQPRISVARMIIRHPNAGAKSLAVLGKSKDEIARGEVLLRTANDLKRHDCQVNANNGYDLAFETCTLAALAGDPVAQDRLGDVYYLGVGVDVDYEQATRWYREAAEQGYRPAQLNLGRMYYSGRATGFKDLERACQMFRQAGASIKVCGSEEGHK